MFSRSWTTGLPGSRSGWTEAGADELLGEQTGQHEDLDLVTSAELDRVRAALGRVRISR
jgi:hypothetical protein